MEMTEIIKNAERNIRKALKDYGAHTGMTEVLEDVSDAFIHQLAYDSSYAKRDLRELFSKSPVWDSALDALVINGTRTRNPDYNVIHDLAFEILNPAILRADCDESKNDIYKAVYLFTSPKDEYRQRLGIEAIKRLAPKAYAPEKKLSRVFKSLCDALGVSDNAAGSDFQRLYAQFADELSSRKIGFKLYVSINPAHFLTMSNPKGDHRGSTLTSCHSFNSTNYSYNNGCSGYARDDVTFIVFTVSDPTDPETFNNRKTTRQIFAYKPGNGLLLQSRLYNTSGGTHGAQEDSKLYRDLIQREISDLEGVVNLWKTYNVCGENHSHDIQVGEGFGGYPDWQYSDFDAKVSIRTDCEDDYDPLCVGTYGLCIQCGEETDEGLTCEDCRNRHRYWCEHCEEYHDSTYEVHNSNGDLINVCENCFNEYYTYCDYCNEYHYNSRVNYIDGYNLCDDCMDEYCESCDECGEYHLRDNMHEAINNYGDRVMVCNGCLDRYYTYCEECENYHHNDSMNEVHNRHGDMVWICEACIEQNYEECSDCGEIWPKSRMENGLCPKCKEETEEAAV